jgi:hypothetical protein
MYFFVSVQRGGFVFIPISVSAYCFQTHLQMLLGDVARFIMH